jgi:hypothetical protein
MSTVTAPPSPKKFVPHADPASLQKAHESQPLLILDCRPCCPRIFSKLSRSL